MAKRNVLELVDAWAEIAMNKTREGATHDVLNSYETLLHIDCASSSTTAHTGTQIIVQVSSATSGDDCWTNFTKFIGPTGTSASVNVDAASAAAATTLYVDSTTSFESLGDFYFVEDTANAANSEIIINNGFGNDDYITCLDNLTTAKDTADDVFNVVESYIVQLPIAVNRVRVFYDNTYDVNGSSVHTRCRVTKTVCL